MIIGNDRCCDDCGDKHATRYYCGWFVKDYCEKCAIEHDLRIFTIL